MPNKVLSVIDSAYRASLEEQDDAGLWFSAAVRNAGSDIDLLLTGNAVNYLVKGHTSGPMKVGGGEIAHPMDPNHDISKMVGKGAKCYYLAEDVSVRGLDDAEKMDGVEPVKRADLAGFLDGFDAIWHW